MMLFAAAANPAVALDTHRADVKRFIAHVANTDDLNKRKLRELLAAARSQPAIIEAMDRRAEKTLPWYQYRPIFVNEQRIQEGVDFWVAHLRDLQQASALTGVAPEFLVAILGVETYYGRLTGRYRVLDALATLAFDYPSRGPFFRDQLEQFLLLTREAKIDPLTATGSYAGAMGAPQFMPSNYRRYAVDASRDGHVDLWTNWLDVLASVGNYLQAHGWHADAPVLSDASVAAGAPREPDGPDLVLSATVGSLQAEGVRIVNPPPADTPAILVAADEADGTHWRVGYPNFYAITRYNHSPLYAMAVCELAAAVKQRLLANPPTRAESMPLLAEWPALAAPLAAPLATPLATPLAAPRAATLARTVNAGSAQSTGTHR